MIHPHNTPRNASVDLTAVSAVAYGCSWGADGHVHPMPLLIRFGTHGPEVTVDQMLEGRGHTYLLVDQIVALIRGLAGTDTPLRLCSGRPPGLGRKLVEAGYYVELTADD